MDWHDFPKNGLWSIYIQRPAGLPDFSPTEHTVLMIDGLLLAEGSSISDIQTVSDFWETTSIPRSSFYRLLPNVAPSPLHYLIETFDQLTIKLLEPVIRSATDAQVQRDPTTMSRACLIALAFAISRLPSTRGLPRKEFGDVQQYLAGQFLLEAARVVEGVMTNSSPETPSLRMLEEIESFINDLVDMAFHPKHTRQFGHIWPQLLSDAPIVKEHSRKLVEITPKLDR
jgi:hypothetical protein